MGKYIVLPQYIRDANDLVTTHEATRAGFLAQALASSEKAVDYIERAREFWNALQVVKHVDELRALTDFRDELVAAAGFSEKARGSMRAEIDNLLREAFSKLVADDEIAFREEILFRYLLTKGDALGGQMRNWVGRTAAAKLSAALLFTLEAKSIEPQVKKAPGTKKIQRMSWEGRLLLFDAKPGIIGKNIDLILLARDSARVDEKALLANAQRYIACGELKGGIDPDGADEHWKTAMSAFERIRACFRDRRPHLFFLGAAIESSMARELYQMLQDGRLSHAANLTVPEQVSDLADWLVTQ